MEKIAMIETIVDTGSQYIASKDSDAANLKNSVSDIVDVLLNALFPIRNKESHLLEKTIYRRAIGDSIRSERERLGISQTDLALEAGIKKQQLSLIEQGKPGAKKITRDKVFDALQKIGEKHKTK